MRTGQRCSGVLVGGGTARSGLRVVVSASIAAVWACSPGASGEGSGGLEFLGDQNDVAAVESLLAHCRARSARLDELVGGLINTRAHSIRVSLERGLTDDPGVLFDSWGLDLQTLDLDDLDLLPPYRDQAGDWSQYHSAPAWSLTKCAVLSHAIVEAYLIQTRYARAGVDPGPQRRAEWFDEAHARARVVEEEVDAELGRGAMKLCQDILPGWFIVYFMVSAEMHEMRFERIGWEEFKPPLYFKTGEGPDVHTGTGVTPCYR